MKVSIQKGFTLIELLIAVGIVAAIALVLAGRAFWLQVAQHQHYLELSQGNRARIEPLPPNRGIIYDRAGRVIAENTPAYQLEILREQAEDLLRAPGVVAAGALLHPLLIERSRAFPDPRATS